MGEEKYPNNDDYFDQLKKNKKKYPELDKISKDISRLVGDEINKRTDKVKSEMPYKAQYVLEKLIEILEKSV